MHAEDPRYEQMKLAFSQVRPLVHLGQYYLLAATAQAFWQIFPSYTWRCQGLNLGPSVCKTRCSTIELQAQLQIYTPCILL